jgi:tetratricopeptide (TPR) repeat protein
MQSNLALQNSVLSKIRWRWHLSIGRMLGWLGYHRFALGHFQSATYLRPKHLLAYFLLGWTYGRLGLYEEAISVFDASLQMAPNRAYAHAHKALCCLRLGRYQEAAHGFERAFRIEPRYRTLPLFTDSLAKCYSNLGHSAPSEEQRDSCGSDGGSQLT